MQFNCKKRRITDMHLHPCESLSEDSWLVFINCQGILRVQIFQTLYETIKSISKILLKDQLGLNSLKYRHQSELILGSNFARGFPASAYDEFSSSPKILSPKSHFQTNYCQTNIWMPFCIFLYNRIVPMLRIYATLSQKFVCSVNLKYIFEHISR